MGAILVRRKSRILPVRIDRLRTPAPGVAQRPFSQAKGDSLAAEFDINKLGYPVVNRADGIDWVIDGQHRTYALRKQHVIPSDGTIECEVYENLSEQQMADLFLGRNRSRPVTAFERFQVAVTAGYAREQAITAPTGSSTASTGCTPCGSRPVQRSGISWSCHDLQGCRAAVCPAARHPWFTSSKSSGEDRVAPGWRRPWPALRPRVVGSGCAMTRSSCGREWPKSKRPWNDSGSRNAGSRAAVRRPTAAPTASGVSGSVRADRARPRFRQPLSAPCRSQVPRQGPAR